MTRKLLTLFLVLSLLPTFASNIVYLRVPATAASVILERLNTLIVKTPTTTDYTLAQYPVVPSSTTDVLIPVEDKPEVQAVVPELWGARLATMPVEFVPEMPQ